MCIQFSVKHALLTPLFILDVWQSLEIAFKCVRLWKIFTQVLNMTSYKERKAIILKNRFNSRLTIMFLQELCSKTKIINLNKIVTFLQSIVYKIRIKLVNTCCFELFPTRCRSAGVIRSQPVSLSLSDVA